RRRCRARARRQMSRTKGRSLMSKRMPAPQGALCAKLISMLGLMAAGCQTNMNTFDSLMVTHDAMVGDPLTVTHNPTVGDSLAVTNNATVGGTVFAGAFSSNSPLSLQTAGTTRIFVDDTTGAVGINTMTPHFGLEVHGGIATSNGFAGGTITSVALGVSAGIGFFSFYTFAPTTTVFTSTGKMDISADAMHVHGLFGVGRDPATNPLEVEGAASKTAAGSWAANSDARIKTDIQTVDGAMETL